ncbi:MULTISPECIES: hypothetical protein [Ectobacillus]|uniref:hypothetical protein n=1 Tax=Ectobacillus TaxID=2837502 RepID=UPI000F5B254F|nr:MULTISPECIES: hypothetical protein [Ectobacillus]UOY92895.1 hypothetical protein MUG87_01755 [Ectobacillus sp. JY-23]
MAYIDTNYYQNEYGGIAGGDSTLLAVLIKRASDVIDQITGYKIAMSPNKLSDFPAFVQEQVKKATAVQTEHFVLNGQQAFNGDALNSVSIGKFRYSGSGASGNAGRTNPAVIEYLKPTGLLYTGVDTL